MSDKNQTRKKQSKDNFSAIEQFYNKYFIDIEQSVPRFQHEFFNLQNEYYKVWKNTVQANILLQKEFSNKIEFFNIPESAQKIIENINEELSRVRLLRDNISISTIERIKKNIKIWNDNINIFSEYNKRILQFWLSTCAKP
ncbi:MAG: hypothetical protein OEL69_04470 [Nitrosopumilus sp.]|nr:hypothetical protein [Nitrosopumilus sp.]